MTQIRTPGVGWMIRALAGALSLSGIVGPGSVAIAQSDVEVASPSPSARVCGGVKVLETITTALDYKTYAKCGKSVATRSLQAAKAAENATAASRFRTALGKYKWAYRSARSMSRTGTQQSEEALAALKQAIAIADEAHHAGKAALGATTAATTGVPAPPPAAAVASGVAAPPLAPEADPRLPGADDDGRNAGKAARSDEVVAPTPVPAPPAATAAIEPPPAAAVPPAVSPGARSNARVIATLESARGGVTVVRAGLAHPSSLSMALQTDDIVVTRQGRASVRFRSDGSMLRIGPDSRVQIHESAKKRDVTVFFGKLWGHVVKAQERLSRFRSGGTIAAIRGTELSLGVAVRGDETEIAVLEGRVEARNEAGSVTLAGGQSAVARKGTAPALGVRVRPQDAVQWALYYGPVIQIDPADLGEGPWQASVRESLQAYQSGDLQRAVDALASVDAQSVTDVRFFTYRASLRLAAGNAEEAKRDIERALRLSGSDSHALALRTIIAVANNDTDQALATGQRAVAANPKSATAYVALSYAQQAAFDLDGAGASLETAVKLDRSDALAWARLAEIRSSQGKLDEALKAAQQAVAIQPSLSRTQTVLGFAHLLRLQTDKARAAFQKAIDLDQDDPLPRLGMGLAEVRDGNVDEGIRHMEVAVSLDPGEAVIRSYLGKAYYEAKRTELSEREYDVAKRADPKDPTPWFYDAITKQTTNRPAEALESAEKSIELNDNRAVYRSRLLLDSDLAARSASLGRIYSDLGFQDRALAEGWLSVNTDPTDHSAHRFLADSYGALPRHEIARVSELFQSQMLQPNNTTPIQPRLGESNLGLISSGGPGSLAFNEFNPLFTRNGVSLQASGLGGTDGLWSGEGVVAGMYDKLSVSAGYSQFETDGFRDGAFQEDKIANAFVQAELTPDTSVQAEYRFRDRANGDLQQRFDPLWVLPGWRDEQLRHTARAGGRHRLTPNSILLASFVYQDSDIDTRLVPDPGPPVFTIDFTAPQTSLGTEVQHLFRSRYFNLTSGVGHFRIDGELHSVLALDGVPLPPDVQQPDTPTKFDHVNLYSYANIKPLRPLMLTVGASFDLLDGDVPAPGGDDYQVNPKVGVMWNPIPSTTIRAALLRTLKRTLVTDQTLEPTQVSGFNQFFDENASDLTEAWRYGGGVDQKIGSHVFAGVEYSRRDLTVPFIDEINFPLEPLREAPWDEEMARAYLFAIPHRWLGLRVQYLFEDYVRDRTITAGVLEVETHRVPLGISFFHPFGLSTSFTATYWHQDGTFEDLFAFPQAFVHGTSDFWLFDASLSYRIPRRYGFVSVGAANLSDEAFEYFDVDFDNPTILPKRAVFAKLTLAVP